LNSLNIFQTLFYRQHTQGRLSDGLAMMSGYHHCSKDSIVSSDGAAVEVFILHPEHGEFHSPRQI